MSVQTNVQVDGQWVTRRMGVDEIIAANRRAEERPEPEPRPSPVEVPRLGLLSRTAVPSPEVEFILPARLRGRRFNDVVFVCDHSIHVKEVLGDGHLRHVTSKTDFRARIRSAKVLGEPLPIQPYKNEDDEAESEMDIDGSTAAPHQFIVLALSSSELMFLFLRHVAGKGPVFVTRSVPLPQGQPLLETPVNHLAVDPRGRALAVAAVQSTIVLQCLKPRREIQSDIRDWENDVRSHREQGHARSPDWCPVRHERVIKVIGSILLMEFLYPAPDDEHHVILCIIKSRGKKLWIECYEWESWSLGPMSSQRYALWDNLGFPVLLVPIQRPASALIAFDRGIKLYENLLAGPPNPIHQRHFDMPTRQPGRSKRQPIYTGWARPSRYFREHKEAVYLVREDGVVQYVIFEKQGPIPAYAGHFNCHMGSAFASLDVGQDLRSPDVLIAAGLMSNGKIWRIGTWKDQQPEQTDRQSSLDPEEIELFPNWTPVLDFAVPKRLGTKNSTAHDSSLFVTSGRDPYGAISELRRGLQARLGIEYFDESFSTATDMWTIPDCDGNGLFVILPTAIRTNVFHIQIDDFALSSASEHYNCALRLEDPTIALSALGWGYLVQVTPKTIAIHRASNDDVLLEQYCYQDLPEDVTCVAATVEPDLSLLATALRKGDEVQVQLGKLEVNSKGAELGEAGEPFSLPEDPTCMGIFHLQTGPYLYAGLTNGLVLMWKILDDRSLQLAIDQTFETSAIPEVDDICETMCLLRSESFAEDSEHEHLMLCGLRNGRILAVPLLFPPRHDQTGLISIGKGTSIQFGDVPVRLSYDRSERLTAAFAICGEHFCRVDYSQGNLVGLVINKIWVSNDSNLAVDQPLVETVARMPQEYVGGDRLGSVVLLSGGDRFMITTLDEEVKMVPRRIETTLTPNKMIYSEPLNSMVVAGSRIVVTKEPERAMHRVQVSGSRRAYGTVQHIKMESTIENDKEVYQIAGSRLDRWERVYCMLEWTRSGRESRIPYLALGTGTQNETGREVGRVAFMKREVLSNGKLSTPTPKVGLRTPQGAVYAMAWYPEKYLVLCAGSSLSIASFDESTKRWAQVTSYDLHSPGINVSTFPPFIYVSTASHSLIILHEQSRATTGKKNADQPFTPERIDHPNVILVSDKSGALTGLYQPPSHLPHSSQFSTPHLFTAHFPRSITRLRHTDGSLRPPWHRHDATTTTLPGVAAADILGSAADGTIYAFSLLRPPYWQLLKFLENL
ncbi:mono-functional DNA-alkylating methyl methanesulfonate N-term-domain-containing protein, partial [Lineolata rhizophorae]